MSLVERDVAGLAILEKAGSVVFALEELGEANVQTLATRAGEPVSSTYRLLSSLVSLGWVDPAPRRGSFRLGLRFIRVGALLEDHLDVRDVCRPALESLRRSTQATTFLCFLRNDAAVCVDRLEGRDVNSLTMRLGDSLPLYRGAAPLAIFAFIPDSEKEAILARFAVRRRAGEDIPRESALLSTIAQVRRQGFSVSDEDVTPGIAAVGAPVFNHRGELEGAVSVSGLRTMILGDGIDVTAATLHAAASASSALGYERVVE